MKKGVLSHCAASLGCNFSNICEVGIQGTTCPLYEDVLFDVSKNYLVGQAIRRGDVVADADGQHILGSVLLPADLHGLYDYPRFPSLQGIDNIDSAELL